MMDVYRGLNDWVDGLPLNLLVLEALEGEHEFHLDFTGLSVQRLERALLSRFGDPEDLNEPEHRELVDGAAGYLGEVLLRLAGGAWRWCGGEPFISTNTTLGLSPIFPLQLITRALRERTMHEFSDVYAAWETAVAQQRAANPEWAPEKEYTPGVDPFRMDPADADYIARWDAERRGAFAHWCATYGAGTVWDFEPASLDALENLLSRITPVPEDLRAPAHRDFVDGAVWYFGEMIRRIKGGRWIYRTPDPESPNPFAGDPYVHQAGDDGEAVMPIVVLRKFVRNRVPGTLRARHERYGGEGFEAS